MKFDWLAEDRDLSIQAILHGEGDERMRFRSAAWEAVQRMVTRNVEKPVTVFGPDWAYLIPVHAIRWIRMRDPEIVGGSVGGPIGFRPRDLQGR